MSSPSRRRYTSSLRQENAEATRLRIVVAARTLLLDRGYAATTMADVAALAGVAVATLYGSFPGGKPGLAKSVYDATLAGDLRKISQAARPEVLAIIAEPDPARKLAGFSAMAVGIFLRVGPVQRVLRTAAAADVDVAHLSAVVEQERRTGSRGLIEHLAAVGALRPGLTMQGATDQVYVLTSAEIFDRFVETCGWTVSEFQTWLARTLTAALLEPGTSAGAIEPAVANDPPLPGSSP